MRKLTTDLKMAMLKKTVKYLVPKVLRLASVDSYRTPQSILLLRVYSRLVTVLDIEEHTGCWNDTNFRDLLEASVKALVFLCEHDKYYKRWLGLLSVIMAEEVAKARAQFDYSDAFNMTVRPLSITEDEVQRHREALFLFNLCGYLYSYTLIPETSLSTSVQAMKLARGRNTSFRLSTPDPDAYVKLFYTPDGHVSFQIFFTERSLSDE